MIFCRLNQYFFKFLIAIGICLFTNVVFASLVWRATIYTDIDGGYRTYKSHYEYFNTSGDACAAGIASANDIDKIFWNIYSVFVRFEPSSSSCIVESYYFNPQGPFTGFTGPGAIGIYPQCDDPSSPFPSCPSKYVPPICPRPSDSGVLTNNPILPATGEKIKLQTDFTDSVPHGLDFTRTYRTAWGDVSPASGMGSNWNHRFGMQLAFLSDSLRKTVQMPDGSQRRFTRSSATAAWVNTDGTDQLVESAAGFLFTNAQTDDVWVFNTSGKPTTSTQRNGWAYTLAYNPSGQLATVTNKFGRQLVLTYNANDLLSGVTAPDGQQISYQYNSDSSLIYEGYGTNSAPNTSSIQYLYENPSFPKALTGMVDESGTRSATYTYDSQGRAISSELAGGADKYQVSYLGSTTAGALNTSATIIDPLGTARSYTYSNTAGSLVVTGANVTSNGQMPGRDAASRVQNDSGLIDSETDYLGVQTMYTWDVTRKLPLSTTKATGRPEAQTTNTTWHPTLRLPMTISEQGRTTNYTYDTTGNRLSQSITDTDSGQVKTTSWTYNTNGLSVQIPPRLQRPA